MPTVGETRFAKAVPGLIMSGPPECSEAVATSGRQPPRSISLSCLQSPDFADNFSRSLPSLRQQDVSRPRAFRMLHIHRPGDAVIVTEIDRFADSVVRSVPVAGMSIVVTRSGQTVVSRGYGVADVSTGRPMTETTASRIGSITKVVTAIATMKLVAQGKIDLDADVRAYLPRLTLPPVTVRQALNHTSGLPDYEGAAIAQWISDRKPITKEFVKGATGYRRGQALSSPSRYLIRPNKIFLTSSS